MNVSGQRSHLRVRSASILAVRAVAALGVLVSVSALAAPLAAQRAPRPRTVTRPSTPMRGRVGAGAADSALRGFQVDTLAEPIPETLVPKYPASLRTRGVQGGVTAEFVVDTLGRIEPETFRVITSDDPAFTIAVRDLIPGARFLPAINEGHLVRQIVRQTFVFDVVVQGARPAAGAPPR